MDNHSIIKDSSHIEKIENPHKNHFRIIFRKGKCEMYLERFAKSEYFKVIKYIWIEDKIVVRYSE